MESIYSNGLYSTAQSPYVLQPTHPDLHSPQYGNQYRSSAFSETRGPPNPYHSPLQQHSAGLSANNSYGHDIHDDDGFPPPPSHWNSPPPSIPWNTSSPPLPPPSRSHYGSNPLPHMSAAAPMQRPRLTTTVWEDEGTICYQVDAKSVCVARRQDNDMINGTKLLNVVGMSRGKRDGILKNEKGRVVVKVGAMHLKGVWITFDRAKDLATKFKIIDILYPLFVDDPAVFLSMAAPPGNGLPMMLPASGATSSSNRMQQYSKNDSYGSFMPSSWDKPYQSLPSITSQQQQDQMIRPHNNLQSGSCSPVPGNITSHPPLMGGEENDVYLLNNPYEYRSGSSQQRPYSKMSPPPPAPHYLYENQSQPFYEGSYGMPARKENDKKDEPTSSTDEKPIDLPTSPPPESYYEGKFSSRNWNRYDAKESSAVPKLRSPEVEEKKSRKRGHDDGYSLQKKRVKVENSED